MHSRNCTCVQRIRFEFLLIEKKKNALIPFKSKKTKKADDLRDLADSIQHRFRRVADMMDILYGFTDNWSTRDLPDRIIMETRCESFDEYNFLNMTRCLSEQGFSDKEYTLNIDYERRWGML